jgi:hypothetical protein
MQLFVATVTFSNTQPYWVLLTLLAWQLRRLFPVSSAIEGLNTVSGLKIIVPGNG